MRHTLRTCVFVGCAFVALLLLTGCHSDERRKVRVTEETHEGQVVEEQPGEMVVE